MPRIPPSFDAQLAALDRIVHEPARLAILTALAECESAEFRYLQALTGLSQGNLSMHLIKLEAHGLIVREKNFSGSYPSTSAHATDAGRAAIARHWDQLRTLRQSAKKLIPSKGIA